MHDPFRQFLVESNIFELAVNNLTPVDVQDRFLDFYSTWINSSQLNQFTGLENFANRYVSLGVTQGLDDFITYCLKTNRKIKIFKGEYPYTREIAPSIAIEDSTWSSGDAVIVSCPFSATGDIHPEWHNLINTCNQLDIPVFVDCAFFGTCRDIQVDFNQPCIDTVAFSPTKGLNSGYFRTGIVFTQRQGKDCSLSILSDWHHGIHFHTYLAYYLMREFGPDTIPNTYTDTQYRVCEHYGLMPTKTVHLALGDANWNHFTRDGVCNRVGLRNAIRDYAYTGQVK